LLSGVIVNLDIIINWANIIGLLRKKRTRLGYPLKISDGLVLYRLYIRWQSVIV
jgi:hypothetical protein